MAQFVQHGSTQRKENHKTDSKTNELKQVSLRYMRSLEAHKFIWLPSDIFNQNTWPIFSF